MTSDSLLLLPQVQQYIQGLKLSEIPKSRREVLEPFIKYLQKKAKEDEPIHLNFICTHNSRRSQMAQIWAKTAADYYDIDAICYSGGVEVTAFNERAVAAIKRCGFKVDSKGYDNPIYSIYHSENQPPIRAFSKLYDDAENQCKKFAAIMTCSHADENCPFIPGTEERIAVRYDDPKEFDGTPQEKEKYNERCRQIATEMFYAFSKIGK